MNGLDRIIGMLTSKMDLAKNGEQQRQECIQKFTDSLFTLAKIRAWQRRSNDITDQDIRDADSRLVRIRYNFFDAFIEVILIIGSGAIGAGICFLFDSKYKTGVVLLLLGIVFTILSILYKLFTK